MDKNKVATELVKIAKVLMAADKYPELDMVAQKITNEVSRMINKEAAKSKSVMPYKAQYILEEVIKKLEKAV